MKRTLLGCFCLCILCLNGASARDIPDRPEELEFPPLSFEVPDADSHRVELNNGIPVYIAEDSLLPLVQLQIFFKGGQYLEPKGKEGLSQITGRVWRTGGAGELSGNELDEELDFLAANLTTGIGETSGGVSLNLLSKDLNRGLQLLMDVLQNPRFQEDRIERAKEDLISAMKRRNDSTAAIERREWDRLIYGEDFWLNQLPTQSSIESIKRQDLVEFKNRLVNPSTMVVAVSGDFQRQQMLEELNQTLGQLETNQQELPPVPQPGHVPEPGVYLIDKPDVNQGRVSMGHLGSQRPFKDEFDIQLGNDVLGGGGFTSWIMSRVRSDEGLAYSAGSSYGIGDFLPGSFRAAFQSKSATVAQASKMVVDLIQKLRTEGVSEQELETSKNSFIQTFPNFFRSTQQTMALFARDELRGREEGYWESYRDRVGNVSRESLRKAASEHLHPEGLVVLIVGNVKEILQGHPDYPNAQIQDLGRLKRLPLRDPMTLEPIVQPVEAPQSIGAVKAF